MPADTFRITHLQLVLDSHYVPPPAQSHAYAGTGTEENPFRVNWLPDDNCNPMNFSSRRKWALNLLTAIGAFIVAFSSSAYSGGLSQIGTELHVNEETTLLGISTFLIGFAFGPLAWAPLSEVYGRRYVLMASGAGLTAFLAGSGAARNMATVLILRLLAGSLGSAPMAIAGGVIADLFPAQTRGFAFAMFVTAPFLGPVLGPVFGGFVAEYLGWRWIQWILTAVSGAHLVSISVLLPETYAPLLLQRRAERLTQLTGRFHCSPSGTRRQSNLRIILTRPWILLVREPIILLFSVYMALIYGTLYMLFAAYPIVFQQARGWSEGLGGLSFLGIMVGILASVPHLYWAHRRYRRILKSSTRPVPEQRLPDCFAASICLPIALFWFAWTDAPSTHWIVPILAGVPFGYGCVMLFLPCFNYLVDSYTIYAASVLAVSAALRSLCGATFPLFTTRMYARLGLHWAASIPAFLALGCVPIPWLFYRYGARIRKRCPYAKEADAIMEQFWQASTTSTVPRG
ncbi:bicyclomycin resistance protein [Aspergillus indologenus CBS 114.80]|uniref:Bicyclomycin resistance protein n=1 Tax=Aspergillus indologenus CBS 114.80 TaxID=1450541 RepID=A0A2V5HQH9_9EURO|nr:bicyclomycin resistance protein [Aspergillus indologenus CBS 114.80]